MNREQAVEKATPIFKKDELLKKLHYTNDGQAFPIEQRAQVHQQQIGGKEADIITVKREEVEEKIAVVVDNGADEVKEKAIADVIDEKADEVKEEE